MKLGDSQYLKLVEEKMHTHKTMSEEETAKEIMEVSGGVFNIEPSAVLNMTVPIITPSGPELDIMAKTILEPKKRGRPKGSRNKPKEIK